MRTSSMLTRQSSGGGGGGRGVCGARKLIPMPLRISRAPVCPRARSIFVRAAAPGRVRQGVPQESGPGLPPRSVRGPGTKPELSSGGTSSESGYAELMSCVWVRR